MACTMCFRNAWAADEARSDMDTRLFDRALDTLPAGVRTVFFGGMGEPLIHRDIIYMVRRARARGTRTELLTNGTLLSREMSERLLDSGLDMLWISLDSLEAGEYEKIRQNAGFAAVKKNISDFNAEREKRESCAGLGIAFVAMKSNIRQLSRLCRFAYENKAGDINVSNVMPADIASSDECLYSRTVSLGLSSEDSGYPRLSLPFMDHRAAEVKEALAGLFETDFNIAPGGESAYRRQRYCKFIGDGAAFIRHDGDVAPCMALLHSGATFFEDKKRNVRRHSFGNVGQTSLYDIWDCPEYAGFRERVKNFEFSPCVRCGGCENRDENLTDCFGNSKPTCGACLWSEGVLSCP